MGCDSDSDDGDGSGTEADTEVATGSSSGGGPSTSESTSSSETGDSTSTTTGSSTSFTTSTTSTTTSMPDGSTGDSDEPIGPGCSVQVVSAEALYDPVERGDEAFPNEVADVLEDYCGCHTLMSGGQNVEWPSLPAPGGTLFLQYSDLNRPFQGGTLGQGIEAEVNQLAMPPGSCRWPGAAADILDNWFAQGQPTGANYVPL